MYSILYYTCACLITLLCRVFKHYPNVFLMSINFIRMNFFHKKSCISFYPQVMARLTVNRFLFRSEVSLHPTNKTQRSWVHAYQKQFKPNRGIGIIKRPISDQTSTHRYKHTENHLSLLYISWTYLKKNH